MFINEGRYNYLPRIGTDQYRPGEGADDRYYGGMPGVFPVTTPWWERSGPIHFPGQTPGFVRDAIIRSQTTGAPLTYIADDYDRGYQYAIEDEGLDMGTGFPDPPLPIEYSGGGDDDPDDWMSMLLPLLLLGGLGGAGIMGSQASDDDGDDTNIVINIGDDSYSDGGGRWV